MVPLPKSDELYAVQNGLTGYYSLDCTSDYNHIAFFDRSTNETCFYDAIWNI